MKKVFIKGYNTFADAENFTQPLEVEFELKVSAKENAKFVDEVLEDLQKFIDEKYN